MITTLTGKLVRLSYPTILLIKPVKIIKVPPAYYTIVLSVLYHVINYCGKMHISTTSLPQNGNNYQGENFYSTTSLVHNCTIHLISWYLLPQ